MSKHDTQFDSLFEGRREECRSWLSEHDAAYYVYVMERPTGEPFFIGRGKGERTFASDMRSGRPTLDVTSNPLRANIIRQITDEGGDVGYRIDSTWSNEQDCREREAELIENLGCWHEGGPLANIAPATATKTHPDRATIDRFLQAIGPAGTIPVKPVALMRVMRPSPVTPHPRPATEACALALMASACAHGIRLEAGTAIPRGFFFEGTAAMIDNGAARDIIASGMADLIPASEPAAECYRLSDIHIQIIRALLGDEMLKKRGLI